MTDEENLEDLMNLITIPNYTVKNSKYQYDQRYPKLEAKRIFKEMKAKRLTWEDLTEHGLELMRKYYPFLFPK